MPNFALKPIESVKGKQSFKKLLIDNECQLDEYEKEIKENKDKRYIKELEKIFNYMNQVANLISLPDNKFKNISPKKEKVNEFEFKSKHLRVYAIKKENGQIIILGGY